MKKFFAILAVLAMTVVANAGLTNVFTYDSVQQFSTVDITFDTFGDVTSITLGSDLDNYYGDYVIYNPAKDYESSASVSGIVGYGYPLGQGVTAYNGLYGSWTGADYNLSLTITNDNNQAWAFFLFAYNETTGELEVTAPSTDLPVGDSAYLSLGLTSGDTYTYVGVGVTNITNGGDNVHYSMTVPAPGAVLLAGLGTSLVGFVRRRSL